MKIIPYTNNQGLELKINRFSSGQFKWAFSLTLNNGVHTFCYTMTELRTILLKKRDDLEMGNQCKRQV